MYIQNYVYGIKNSVYGIKKSRGLTTLLLVHRPIGFILSVCPSVRYAFLRTRYLKNRLRYGVDIWYTFRRSGASNLARVIPLFVQIKCLVYLGYEFV